VKGKERFARVFDLPGNLLEFRVPIPACGNIVLDCTSSL
jgi:hypothetical protein